MRVAFYGGSFNPPHVAHVLAVTYALSVGGFERVLVVPVYSHAFDKQLCPFEHRVCMCGLAMGWLPGVEVSRVEASLETPSLTLRTLEHLRAAHPDYQLRLMVGADVLGEADKWYAFDRVGEIAPPYVLGRVGVRHPDAPPPVVPDVSSTRIRALLSRRGSPEADAELSRSVPWDVLAYIDEHGLYRGEGSA
jgi:nicotinate-nucleotide adenylyltransferase